MRLLDYVESGKRVLELMKERKVSQGTVSNIKRHPDRTRTRSVQQQSKEGKRVRLRKFDDIGRDLFRQYEDARKLHSALAISGLWLRENWKFCRLKLLIPMEK